MCDEQKKEFSLLFISINTNVQHLSFKKIASLVLNLDELYSITVNTVLYIQMNQSHLVHKHQRSLMAVVYLLISWICYTPSFNLFPSLSQIVVPQFVTAQTKHN